MERLFLEMKAFFVRLLMEASALDKQNPSMRIGFLCVPLLGLDSIECNEILNLQLKLALTLTCTHYSNELTSTILDFSHSPEFGASVFCLCPFTKFNGKKHTKTKQKFLSMCCTHYIHSMSMCASRKPRIVASFACFCSVNKTS